MGKFVVLLVEDAPVHQQLAKIIIEPHAELLIAGTVTAGYRYLLERSDITHVILDGYVPRFESGPTNANDNTLELATHILHAYPEVKSYSASSDSCMNHALVLRGCINADKKAAPRMVVMDVLSRAQSKI